MDIVIKNFATHTPKDPSKPGAKKGTFGFEVELRDDTTGDRVLVEINQCQYFDNGKSKWMGFPEKREPSAYDAGKWEHKFFYGGIKEPESVKASIMKALAEYLATEHLQ